MHAVRDRVALITGAASGIGRAVARRLAAQGARIAGLDLQAEGLEKLGAELGGAAYAYAVADVTDAAATAAAVAQLETRLGPTDLLLASAGIGRATSATDFKAEDVADIVRVNLIGVANTIAAVLPGMRERRRGHLAVLSSLASYRGIPHMAAYSASKAGVNALLDSLRVELRPFGIVVTTICPGWVRTPLTATVPVHASQMMDVEHAADRIVAALAARRRFVAFPTGLTWKVRLVRFLPLGLADWVVRRMARLPGS